MRLPRDLSGTDLAQALGAFSYQITRQTGGHLPSNYFRTWRASHHYSEA
jgi:hypothetical protein